MSATKFVVYIEELLRKRGVTAEELCRGICSVRQWIHIKNGERMPDSLLRNALLERLGEGTENYENYLSVSDYMRWERQMKIFDCMNHERWEEAESYLEEYQKQEYIDLKNKLEAQFVFCMRGQIRCNQGAEREELQSIFQRAVELTVPDGMRVPIKNMALSIKELNLLLEMEYFGKNGGRAGRYLEIMTYVDEHLDNVGKAKIYPKAVFMLFQCRNSSFVWEELSRDVKIKQVHTSKLAVVRTCCNNFLFICCSPWIILCIAGCN